MGNPCEKCGSKETIPIYALSAPISFVQPRLAYQPYLPEKMEKTVLGWVCPVCTPDMYERLMKIKREKGEGNV